MNNVFVEMLYGSDNIDIMINMKNKLLPGFGLASSNHKLGKMKKGKTWISICLIYQKSGQ